MKLANYLQESKLWDQMETNNITILFQGHWDLQQAVSNLSRHGREPVQVSALGICE